MPQAKQPTSRARRGCFLQAFRRCFAPKRRTAGNTQRVATKNLGGKAAHNRHEVGTIAAHHPTTGYELPSTTAESQIVPYHVQELDTTAADGQIVPYHVQELDTTAADGQLVPHADQLVPYHERYMDEYELDCLIEALEDPAQEAVAQLTWNEWQEWDEWNCVRQWREDSSSSDDDDE